MCQPASFVATKDRVFWSLKTDSHTAIIAEHGLHEDGVRGVNVAKVEITPPNGDFAAPLAKWNYKLDQDRTPEWYEAAEVESRCRRELERWVDERVIGDGVTLTIDDGRMVWALAGSRVEALGSSRVVALGSSRVVAWGSSSVVALGSSSVEALDNSRVEARDNSRVEARDNSSVVALDNSRVEALGSSRVVALDNSRVEACDHHATARVYSDSELPQPVGPHAVVIDSRGEKSVCITESEEPAKQ